MVSTRPRGREFGFKTPSLDNSWFQDALVEEYLVSKRPRGRIVGFKTPSWKNSWFQNAPVEELLVSKRTREQQQQQKQTQKEKQQQQRQRKHKQSSCSYFMSRGPWHLPLPSPHITVGISAQGGPGNCHRPAPHRRSHVGSRGPWGKCVSNMAQGGGPETLIAEKSNLFWGVLQKHFRAPPFSFVVRAATRPLGPVGSNQVPLGPVESC